MKLRLTREGSWRYGPAVVAALAIPALSLAPAWLFCRVEESLPPIPGFDKLVHALMYAVLTAACAHALPPARQKSLRALACVAFAAALYGALMELCQYWLTSTRARDIGDAFANAAGALACATLLFLWAHRPRPKHPPTCNL
jgi:VanZ family protein